jgi:hypothetical protein
MTLLLVFSCKHKVTDSERYKTDIKATVKLLTKKVDSYTQNTGIRKTIFVIDTTKIKFKNLVRVDKVTASRIRNGEMIMEDEFMSKIDTFKTELYYFGNLTNTFKDTTYLILLKEQVILMNIRLYLVRIKKDKMHIKLLAADENQFCMSTMTTSALLGDSIIFTQQTSDAISDAIGKDNKTYFVKTARIKKYKLKDNSYKIFDHSRTTSYK